MATSHSTAAPERADHAGTAPLSADRVVAEQRRIERELAVLSAGESAVINGTRVTAISLRVADLLDRYQAASSRCRRLSAVGDFDRLLAVQDEMRECRCQLAAAGCLDLIGVA
ncbi:hypothetical protein [Streptomyces sp.]|uniref:hypothetical protein n=1 Tax=Streptomyces sp. TaxID=1931 RepID=UPI002F94D8B9